MSFPVSRPRPDGGRRPRSYRPVVSAASAAAVVMTALAGVPAHAETNAVLTGVLVAAGTPVSGGVVSSSTTGVATTTRSDGTFTLPVPSGESTGLRFSDGRTTRVSTQNITPVGEVSLGTVTMPQQSTTTYRVVDGDGTAVYRALLDRDAPLDLTAGNWADHGTTLNAGAPVELTALGGTWDASALTDGAGVAEVSHPVLNGAEPLLDTATYTDPHANTWEADWAAVTGAGTQADPLTLPLPGFEVRAPEAAYEVSASQIDPIFPTFVKWRQAAEWGAQVTSFTVTASPGGRTVTVAAPFSEWTDERSAQFDDMRDGTYTFTVVANSAVGSSPASAASQPFRLIGIPDAPASVTATAPSYSSVQVSWTPVTATAVTGYKVTLSNGAVQWVAPTVTSTSLSAGAGQTVTASVIALNQGGLESAPRTSAPVTVPTPPVVVTPDPEQAYTDKVARPKVKVKGSKVIVTWSAPTRGRLPITKYKVLRKPGKAVVVKGTSTKAVFKGLAPRTYRFAVVAYSAAGASMVSAYAKAVVK